MIRQDWSTLKKLMFAKTAAGGAAAVEYTATGNPLTFLTDLAKPLKSLIVNFLPVQASGTPSPENELPITGWTGVAVNHARKNLINVADRQNGYISSNGTIAADNSNISFGYVLLKKNAVYTVSTSVQVSNIGTCLYDLDKTTVISRENHTSRSFVTIQTGTKDVYLRVWINYDGSTQLNNKTDEQIIDLFAPQLEVGSSATAYEPYTAPDVYPVSWSSEGTVYGGYVDLVTGEVWANRAEIVKNTADMNNSEDYPGWKNSGIESIVGAGFNRLVDGCMTNISPLSNLSIGANTAFNGDVLYLAYSYFHKTQSEWKALALDVQIVVPYPSPVLITTLTPQQITALIGNNTMWSDADGSMTATYLKKG